MLTPQQIQYFENLTPGKIIQFDKAKDPEAFKEAVLDYIDVYGHRLSLCNGGEAVICCKLPPKEIGVSYFFNY